MSHECSNCGTAFTGPRCPACSTRPTDTGTAEDGADTNIPATEMPEVLPDDHPVLREDSESAVESDSFEKHRWEVVAEENVEKWGNQRPKGLTLALAEELAEVASELIGAPGLPRDQRGTEADALLDDIRGVGLRAQSYLERECEDDEGDPLPMDERPDMSGVENREAAIDETDDLAPLVYQLRWALEDEQ